MDRIKGRKVALLHNILTISLEHHRVTQNKINKPEMV
jgi:hypothetical protein